MSFVCGSGKCTKAFETEGGLAVHRTQCKSGHDLLSNLLKRRHNSANGIKNPPMKLSRRTATDVTQERAKQASEAGSESTQASSSRSKSRRSLRKKAVNTVQAIQEVGDQSSLPEPQVNPGSPDRGVYATRSGRQRKHPRWFADMVPSLPTPIPHMPPPRRSPPPEPDPTPSELPQPEPEPQQLPPEEFATEPNEFGLFRVYTAYPQHDPEDAQTLDDLCNSPSLSMAPDPQLRRWWTGLGRVAEVAKASFFAPFMNVTVYRLMSWFYEGSAMKTQASLDNLVQNVILAPDFDQDHLKGFSAAHEFKRLDESSTGPELSKENGWISGSVDIRLPCEGFSWDKEETAPTFNVQGVHHRSLKEVIETTFQDVSARAFHYTPFKLFHRPSPDAEPERVITELYNSDAFLEEHEKLKKAPQTGPYLETAITAIMLWSDSTHLANFGTASLWPIYCYFWNQSKYSRAKPTSFAAHHLAYIPSLKDVIQDFYRNIFKDDLGRSISASKATLTHLKRELMHAIWEHLLDDDFIHAYIHGMVIKCADGITRLIFPRFFTYGADYPEKALLATIRFLGGCPCPRCEIKKDQISAIGTAVDMQQRQRLRVDTEARQYDVNRARELIFESGYGPGSAPIDRILQPTSQVPTCNAFSKKLSKFGFNFFQMFVPDLLHEFELGTWKGIFTHLLRILYANGDGLIQELNRRYCQVPTFGRDTIRKFGTNASGMKKLAARDFEDLLQCSIPVFERLLPGSHNERVLDLLFALCEWHALAKLRLHTSSTLQSLSGATTAFGHLLRRFVMTTCAAFVTTELPQEEAARGRCQACKASKKGKGKEMLKGKLVRTLNLFTYKLHALGDYVSSIWRFGPTDGYSTQVGELEHRQVKKFYARKHKQTSFTLQIARHQRHERLVQKAKN